jgi:hypothetical protein
MALLNFYKIGELLGDNYIIFRDSEAEYGGLMDETTLYALEPCLVQPEMGVRFGTTTAMLGPLPKTRSHEFGLCKFVCEPTARTFLV